ncbi:MAG TPA: sensor domain-containing diguanylate cyclase, partial [Longimicrobiaceae bacterium]|nr:sensor domain-containing diguanylate cyclase [Longimicrobiaceae bacterium]
ADQPAAPHLTIPTPAGRPDPRTAALGAGAAYAAVLLSLRWWNVPGLWALTIALGALAGWLLRGDGDEAEPVAAAWPPLHLAIILTGGIHSPLIALAGAWVAVLGRRAPRWLVPAAAFAAVAVPAVHFLRPGGTPPPSDLLRYLLVVLAGGAAAHLLGPAAPRTPSADTSDEPPEPRAPGDPAPDDDESAVARTLELLRRAADAHEATLWRVDGGHGSTVVQTAWTAAPGVAPPQPVVDLEGHPFGWTIHEQVHVHLQRGKRALPSPWAQEMLLVPVHGPDGVLAFAFPGVVPPGTEPIALEAGRHISGLLHLLAVRRASERDERRMQALVAAVQTLPGELEMDAFARALAAAVCAGAGADGAAVALASVDGAAGRVLHVETARGAPPKIPPAVGEGDSRLALAMKHGVALTYADLRRERDRLPLFAPREEWDPAPRSAAFIPLMADGRTLGAVVVWHAQPGHFGERETELLRLLCSVAPLPFRSATQYEALDKRASTDALTGLPNRRTFETRLASAAGYHDRYARPFGVIILDVDHFKRFNDTWGHEAGDRVLQHVAETVRTAVRDVDLPARLGGEEFVVLLPETGLRASVDAAERIRRAVEARGVVWNGRPLSVTISLGVSACPDCVGAPADALAAADAALYKSKANGRNRVTAAPRAGAPESGTAV